LLVQYTLESFGYVKCIYNHFVTNYIALTFHTDIKEKYSAGISPVLGSYIESIDQYSVNYPLTISDVKFNLYSFSMEQVDHSLSKTDPSTDPRKVDLQTIPGRLTFKQSQEDNGYCQTTGKLFNTGTQKYDKGICQPFLLCAQMHSLT